MDPAHDYLLCPYVLLLVYCVNAAHFGSGAASFTIYTRTKEYCRDRNWFTHNNILDVAAAGGLGFVQTL